MTEKETPADTERPPAGSACLEVLEQRILLAGWSGTIEVDTTWAGYAEVVGDVTVKEGVTLRVQPGCAVKFRDDCDLIVRGTLLADGATFTSLHDDSVHGNDDGSTTPPSPGDWGSIRFIGQESSGSRMTGCTVRYAGVPYPYTSWPGVYFVSSAATVADCKVLDCLKAAYGMTVDSEPKVHVADLANDVRGNKYNGLWVDEGTLPGDAAWGNTTIPHVLAGYVTVPLGRTLTISPGLVIKPIQDATLLVHGRLLAQGTKARPIIFTSLADDSAINDTNNSAVAPVMGDWDRIYFYADSPADQSILEHMDLRYGGSGGAVITLNGASQAVRHCRIVQGGRGVGLYNGAEGQIENTVIIGAKHDGIEVMSGSHLTAANNTICGSTKYGVLMDNAGGTTTLVNNIIAFCGSGGIYQLGGTWTIRYNDVYNPGCAYGDYYKLPNQTGANGNISAAPSFRDRARDDLHLSWDSPCIGAGDPGGDYAGQRDMDDEPRVLGPRVDIGADEYSGDVDVGDLFAVAHDLGALETWASWGEQIGNGPYGPRDVDMYRLTLARSGVLSADLDAAAGGSTLDGFLRLFDADGKELAASDDAAAPGETASDDGFLQKALPAGTYYVGVSGYANILYDPQRANHGSAPCLRGGPYSLCLSFAPGDLPGPGEVRELAGFRIAADRWTQSADGTLTTTGTILTNGLIELVGTLSFDPRTQAVSGSGQLWIRNLPKLGDVLLCADSFALSAGQILMASLNGALGDVSVVGMGGYVQSIGVAGDTAQICGRVTLPAVLGGVAIDFRQPHYVGLTAAGELAYDMVLELPDVAFSLDGMSLASTSARLELSNSGGEPTGTLTGQFRLDLPPVATGLAVDLSQDDGSYFRLNSDGTAELLGAIELERLDIAKGLYLKDVRITLDTAGGNYSGQGTVGLPLGTGIEVWGKVEIEQGELETIGLEVQDLNKPIWTSPPIFLQTIGGQVSGLSSPPLVISPHVVLTAGPQIAGSALMWLDLTADLDLSGRVAGTASVKMGGEDDPLAQGTMQIIWDRQYGVCMTGHLDVWGEKDPLFALDGRARADGANNFQGRLSGLAGIPKTAPIIGKVAGGRQIQVDAYLQANPNGSASDDYVIAAGTITFPVIGPVRHAIEMNLNTRQINWNADLSRLKDVRFPGVGGLSAGGAAAPEAPAGPSAPEPFAVDPGVEWVIFRAEWEQGDADLELTDPLGDPITPANVGDWPNMAYCRSADIPEAYYVVSSPAAGEWQLRLTETDGIGQWGLEQFQHSSAPSIAVVEPGLDTVGGTVAIAWTDQDDDSDATISLYCDADRMGADGTLITTGISQDADPDGYAWDTTGVPTGDYYIYAVIDDGANIPAVSYSTGRVHVADPQAPPQVTGLSAPEGGPMSLRLTWDASAAADLDHYLVRLTADAAGDSSQQNQQTQETQTLTATLAELTVEGLTAGETYRAAVAAVDVEGHVGPDGEPIVAVIGGAATEPPGQGQWDVFARPGTLYEAQVPGQAGDVFTLIDAPAGATIDADGLFRWSVPPDADGWQQVLVHVADGAGNVAVWRHHLLSDGAGPVFAGATAVEVVDQTALRITAPPPADASGVIQYRLQRDGQVVADWQTSPVFVDGGLAPNAAYAYCVQARDASPDGWLSVWTAPAAGRTAAAVPICPILGPPGRTSVELAALGQDGNPAGTQYAIREAAGGLYVGADSLLGDSPIWRTAGQWAGTVIAGLTEDARYAFQAAARNAAGAATAFGPAAEIWTAAEDVPPTVSAGVWQVPGSIVLDFSEPVAISRKDLRLTDAGGSPVDLSQAMIEHEPGAARAVIAFPARPPEGRYTVTISGWSVQDLAGNLLDGDCDGLGGDDGSESILVAVFGDADADGEVGFLDYLAVKAAFGLAGGAAWSDGDFDADGDVDF